MDTTIKVDGSTRDRLAVLAKERGLTMRDLVDRLARETLTQDELRRRATQAEEYVRTRIAAGLTRQELAAAEDVWVAVEDGDAPECLPEPRPRAA